MGAIGSTSTDSASKSSSISPHMRPKELRQAAEYLHGPGWRAALASQMNVHYSTVNRWASGEVPIPGPVAIALDLLVEREANEQQAEG